MVSFQNVSPSHPRTSQTDPTCLRHTILFKIATSCGPWWGQKPSNYLQPQCVVNVETNTLSFVIVAKACELCPVTVFSLMACGVLSLYLAPTPRACIRFATGGHQRLQATENFRFHHRLMGLPSNMQFVKIKILCSVWIYLVDENVLSQIPGCYTICNLSSTILNFLHPLSLCLLSVAGHIPWWDVNLLCHIRAGVTDKILI